MHLALNGNSDEAPLSSGVPPHKLLAPFISDTCSRQEPGRREANEMDSITLIRGGECHRSIQKMRTPHINCV